MGGRESGRAREERERGSVKERERVGGTERERECRKEVERVFRRGRPPRGRCSVSEEKVACVRDFFRVLRCVTVVHVVYHLAPFIQGRG